LDNGKAFGVAKVIDLPIVIQAFEYFAGFSEKINGEVIDSSDDRFLYTRREPIGIVGAIVPFNFPLCMLSWKLAPALITGMPFLLLLSLKKKSAFCLNSCSYNLNFRKCGYP